MNSLRDGRALTPTGFPHSEIPGSKPVCGSPRLIAAYRVLRRLSAPRHPPCTLSSLTKLELSTLYSANPIASNPIQLSMNNVADREIRAQVWSCDKPDCASTDRTRSVKEPRRLAQGWWS